MIRFPAVAALFALVATPLAAQAAGPAPAPPPLPELDAEQKAQLTCSAVFAIVASDQARGEEAALRFPPLKVRGREYFVRFGARTIDKTGITRETVKVLLESEVERLQKLAAAVGDPQGTLTRTIAPCLPRLDAEVPPLAKPTLGQCAAILTLAYEEVHAREGMAGPEARDLKILSAVVESRQRKALAAKGLSGDAIDRSVAQEHDRMLKEALGTGPGVEKYDLQTCYEFAKPDEKSHY
ncbi:hypothetical protein [Novosphingobium sp. Gsoil 351]|uniref:hypothetical protein n=1 Tax=Novosphingobium sp. Gsoil 351 TaxID=2675225 RepID=UPI0012B4594B|nr:hypothetical protein [Novosphingobium sp. Gsoil 351]QGN55242.1 hypothetical protein GKE62_12520 [Novosphingobium sp. Gsoil 351]